METDDFQSFWVKEQGLLSGSFSVGWAKAGAWLGPLLDPSALHTPKGFILGPLMAEL